MGRVSRYEQLESLRSSIFGEILLCRNAESEGQVIIKTVDLALALKHTSRNNEFVHENVLKEVDVLNQLEELGGHPNIIRMQDFYVVNGGKRSFLHMVLDYCDGGDLLDSCLQTTYDASTEIGNGTTRMEERMALRYVNDVLHGLCFLHENGIAHRDISLENILLQNGRAVIADFGLCARKDSKKNEFRCSEMVGKHYYMAPEVVCRSEYDPCQADVWSVGIALFILLTTSPPFDMASRADSGFRYVAKHGIGAVVKAWNLTDSISEETQDLLSKMLTLDPLQRPRATDLCGHPAFSM